ncbi:MAG: twin-arginine translocation signal domain-containing protein [Campylobacteraceae bacterium]|nr:twin-arginine translocation signal domain-containing protein [Campylobacteraceae bacterium]
MQEGRRGFLKKAAVAGALTTVGTVVASGKQAYNSNGVVVGKSPKKEILYKKTQAWELFYQTAQ